MKKIIALVLAMCLLLAAVPGFALELLSGADTYPMNATDKTITWYAQDGIIPHEKFVDWTESPFHTNLSKQVGLNIDWMFPTTGSDGGTFTNALMADPSNLPNIMSIYCASSATEYMDDGLIWDLTPYIQEYAPAYYAFLQANPAYDKAMKDDQGRYYAFGFFREDGGWNDTYQGPVIRTDWLAECGLEMPKTISEFENVMRVFNEKYGAVFTGAWERFQYMNMCGAFGAYGGAYMSYSIVDGKVILAQTTDGYRAYVSWMNKMWEEGLIDQDLFSMDDSMVKTKVLNNKVGIGYSSMGQITSWNKSLEAEGKEPVWVGLAFPTADDGSLSAIFGGYGIDSRTTVITKSTDEETMKLCLRALDYAYTQEGFMYWNYGIEGDTWTTDENGVTVYTEKVTNDTDSEPLEKYVGTTRGAPSIQATNMLYQKNSTVAIEANNTWYYVYPDDAEKNLAVTAGWKWPNGTTYTYDESEELAMIGTGVYPYVSESYAAFVVGTKDIDDDAVWTEYLAKLEDLNLTRILEIKQDTYDRYLAR